jgi:hypothetical protein
VTLRAYCTVLLLAGACTLAPGTLPDGAMTSSRDGGAGGADGGRDAGTGTGLHADNACAVLNAAHCSALQRCGLVGTGDGGLEACAAALTETECGPAYWPSRVAAGTLRMLPSVVAACAQAWAGRPCELVQEPPDVCGDFLLPAAGSGGPCYGGTWTECPGGEVCRGLACPRTCRPPGNAGEDCTANADCLTDAGLFCLPAGDGRTGLCAMPAAEDAPCDARTRCADGLFCGAGGTCETRNSARTPCAAKDECLETLFCALGSDGGTCVARSPDGTPCTATFQCRPGSVCVPQSGRCAPRGPLPRTAGCGTGQACAPGLTCAGRTAQHSGLCLLPLGPGAPCLASDDCHPHLACIEEAGTWRCSQRSPAGTPCGSDRECQAVSACIEGTCTPLPLSGSPCAGGECLHGACVPAADGDGVCGGLLGPNAPCSDDAACASGRCVSGACLASCAP